MEYFEVPFTPSRVVETRKLTKNREPMHMTMAPFTGKDVITFEEIPLGRLAHRYLIIENPTELPLHFAIVRKSSSSKAVKRVSLAWNGSTIPSQGEVTVEICWSPLEPVHRKEMYIVSDQRGFKKDLHVIFKTMDRKVVVRKGLTLWTSASMGGSRFKTPSPPQRKVLRCPTPEIALKSPKISPGTKKRARKSSPSSNTGNMDNIVPVRLSAHDDSTSGNETDSVLDDFKLTPSATMSVFEQRSLQTNSSHNFQVHLTSSTAPMETEGKNTSTKAFYNRNSPEDEFVIVQPQTGILFDGLVDAEPVIPCNGNADTYTESHLSPMKCDQHRTAYLVPKTVLSCVERIVTTPLHRKSSESMRDLSLKRTREQILLKLNQGSMPNLNEIENITSIEGNRYYSQIETERRYSVTSGTLLAETEMPSQSSCCNSHEMPDKAARGDDQVGVAVTSVTKLVKSPLITLSPRTEFKEVPRMVFYDIERHLQAAISPDPFAATTTNDPFLSATIYLDERSAAKYEKQFKNWLNALVTVPDEIRTDSVREQMRLDIGKVFNEVRNKRDTLLVQTKESVSCRYFTKYRLPHLRRVAVALYTGDELGIAFSKLDGLIEKKQLAIRLDRDLHLDLLLQRQLLELLLCFNTLWLRIGLEVVFGEEIQLSSNSDVYGLTGFIVNRVFRDRYLESRYNRNFTMSANYAEQIKKITLCKLMHLVVFLDRAKEARIIQHNPCLFMRAAPVKETRLLLTKITCHLIGNIGDISKYLKRLGLTLTHKQSYLDEFDYAFTNLAVDLRDGIRLTKVMETILLRDDLSQMLRYPAISRLQKVHNVNMALRALCDADYQIGGDICAKDIVDGHREKTLSLLWQIIYKFRAPKFNAAARTIQRWWSAVRLRRTINCRVREAGQRRLIASAIVIQKHFRGFQCRRLIPAYIHERIVATVIIQAYFRAFIARKKFRQIKNATINLQSWWRNWRQTLKQRQEFVAVRGAAIAIQRRFKANVAMRIGVKEFEQLKRATVFVQRRLRAMLQMRKERNQFTQLKRSTVTVQRQFRAQVAMRVQRRAFEQLKWAVRITETAYMAKCAGKVQRMTYLRLRWAAVTIQRQFRAQLAMKWQRTKYLTKKASAITIQQYFRGYLRARQAFRELQRVKWATTLIQRRYRNRLAVKRIRNDYLKSRTAIVAIQRWYRSLKLGAACRQKYLADRELISCIQTRWRANLEARTERRRYLKLQRATLTIQRRFRAMRVMQLQRLQFVNAKGAAICIQRKWRARTLGRCLRDKYLYERKLIVLVQLRWRATMAMRANLLSYKRKRRAIRIIQTRWRAELQMRTIRAAFEATRRAVVTVQTRWRAVLQMRQLRHRYIRVQWATVIIQKYSRGLRTRMEYKQLWDALNSPEAIELRLRNKAAAIIQAYWRGFSTRRRYQTKAMKVLVVKMNSSRRNQKDKVTVNVFLSTSIKRLESGLDVVEATKIFKALDFYSRVVPHLLEKNCVEVAKYCYTMLSQAIRSEPHKYLIELCCRVVLNLARFPPTKQLIFLSEYLDTISHVLLRWSDKECPIFNTLCTLIFVLIQTPQHQKLIKNYMLWDGTFIMQQTKKAVARKERMLNNRQKMGVFRSKVNEPIQERKRNSHVKPSLECDFGMELPGFLYAFKSRVYAFDTLLAQLKINL